MSKMPDLDERFRLITGVRPPDLWPEIERRRPLLVPEGRWPRRAPAIAVALAVAVGGLALAVRAFLEGPSASRPATAVGNGVVAFASDVASDVYEGDTQSEIFTMSVDGTERVRLTRDPQAFDEDPAWSPNGTRIAFIKVGDLASPGIYVMNADGSDPRQILEDATGPTSPSWSSDGPTIVFETGLGHERTGSGDRDIYAVDVSTGDTTRLTTDPARDEYPALSPDGSAIAFTRQNDGDADLFVMNADGSGLTRLTSGPGIDLRPTWSPDGASIAFERDGDVYVMNADGSGVAALTEGSPEDRDPTWAPDGTLIAFVRDGDIYEIHPDGSEVTEVTDDGAGHSDLAWQAVPAKVLTSTPSSQT
jgi:Tol biopolymer transport system component